MRRAAERIDVCGSQCTGISAILDSVFFVLIADGEGDGDGDGEVTMEFMSELGFVILLLCFLLKKSMYLWGEWGGGCSCVRYFVLKAKDGITFFPI